jgi:hypothetical protein
VKISVTIPCHLSVLEARRGETPGSICMQNGIEEVLVGQCMLLLSTLFLTDPLHLAAGERRKRILISHSISVQK